MRLIIFTTMCLLAVCLPADDWSGTITVPAAGNLSVAIPDDSWHQTPLVDFFRRLDRIVRQTARFDSSSDNRQVIIQLSKSQSEGSCKFIYSRQQRKHILQIPLDYRKLPDQPQIGRYITMAIIQSRLGNAPNTPLPEAAYWIADGLWAEFAQREKSGSRILRFTDLPALRNIAENTGTVTLNAPALLSPPPVRYNSAEWTLYCERARLLLEVQKTLQSKGHSNLLKDYCFLLFGKQLKPQECFQRVFTEQAQKKLSSADPQTALDILAMQRLFSIYIPMAPAAVERKFRDIIQIKYLHPNGNFEMTAALSDLPFLVEKYDSCVSLPRRKIIQLNNLSLVAPAALRGDILKLTNAIAEIGSQPAYRPANEIKRAVQHISDTLDRLKRIDNELAKHEKSLMPLLYDQRFALEAVSNRPELPLKVKDFIDAAEVAHNK